jgi:hypothetical protein
LNVVHCTLHRCVCMSMAVPTPPVAQHGRLSSSTRLQQRKCNMQHTSYTMQGGWQQTVDPQHATCNFVRCDLRPTTYDLRPTTYDLRPHLQLGVRRCAGRPGPERPIPAQMWAERRRTAVKPSPNLRKTTSPDSVPIRCSNMVVSHVLHAVPAVPGVFVVCRLSCALVRWTHVDTGHSARTLMLKPRVAVEVCSAPRSPTTGCDGVGLQCAASQRLSQSHTPAAYLPCA